jgi:hypothetical protein
VTTVHSDQNEPLHKEYKCNVVASTGWYIRDYCGDIGIDILIWHQEDNHEDANMIVLYASVLSIQSDKEALDYTTSITSNQGDENVCISGYWSVLCYHRSLVLGSYFLLRQNASLMRRFRNEIMNVLIDSGDGKSYYYPSWRRRIIRRRSWNRRYHSRRVHQNVPAQWHVTGLFLDASLHTKSSGKIEGGLIYDKAKLWSTADIQNAGEEINVGHRKAGLALPGHLHIFAQNSAV